jgi:hypothetical protein
MSNHGQAFISPRATSTARNPFAQIPLDSGGSTSPLGFVFTVLKRESKGGYIYLLGLAVPALGAGHTCIAGATRLSRLEGPCQCLAVLPTTELVPVAELRFL